MSRQSTRSGASFRDPSGFIFSRDGELFRQVNNSYQKEFDKLVSSGLHDDLTAQGRLVRHSETSEAPADASLAYKVIRPEPVQFISYPYEWSFSQLKDAALLTLEVTKSAIQKGMILKDASAYNIQFVDGSPVLIDTLSFGIYKEGKPWEAYRQFCQHFLAPLALASFVDIRLIQLLRVHIDGIPLDLASGLLPQKTRLGLSGLALHIHIHARAQKQFANNTTAANSAVVLGKAALLNLINGLEKTVASLKWEPKGTEWGDYYNVTNYNDETLKLKGELVGSMIEQATPKTVWDLGANNGLFSREASKRGIETIASDIDPAAVEKDYLAVKQYGEKHLLPLVIDLTNPSASIGWAHQERDSLLARGPVDLVMALALIHHLAISNNVPLEKIAEFFASAGKWTIVEFVPKSDSQVKRLLATRKDIFPEYHEEGFEKAFGKYFKLEKKLPIQGSERTLYLFRKK
jgi:2-polyprenyl-3-methyl-5-hydroxy-6-metoxy-1,4-benzoquinol methylase